MSVLTALAVRAAPAAAESPADRHDVPDSPRARLAAVAAEPAPLAWGLALGWIPLFPRVAPGSADATRDPALRGECEMLAAVQEHLRWLQARRPVGPALQAAWRRFYGEYDPAVRQVVTAAGIPLGLADDCVQEAWLEIARVLPRFRYDPSRGSLRTWLKAVVLRRARRAARRLGRPGGITTRIDQRQNPTHRPGRSGGSRRHRSTSRRAAESPTCPRTPCPVLSSMQAELRQAVRTAIVEFRTRVSRVAFRVFLRCEVQGQPAPAVAARLGLTAAQVWTHRSRTRRRFRRFLEAGAFGEFAEDRGSPR